MKIAQRDRLKEIEGIANITGKSSQMGSNEATPSRVTQRERLAEIQRLRGKYKEIAGSALLEGSRKIPSIGEVVKGAGKAMSNSMWEVGTKGAAGMAIKGMGKRVATGVKVLRPPLEQRVKRMTEWFKTR